MKFTAIPFTLACLFAQLSFGSITFLSAHRSASTEASADAGGSEGLPEKHSHDSNSQTTDKLGTFNVNVGIGIGAESAGESIGGYGYIESAASVTCPYTFDSKYFRK